MSIKSHSLLFVKDMFLGKQKFDVKQLKLNQFMFDVRQLKMNKFIFDVKQLKVNNFIKSILQLIISTLNATFEVPSLYPCSGSSVSISYCSNEYPEHLDMLILSITFPFCQRSHPIWSSR